MMEVNLTCDVAIPKIQQIMEAVGGLGDAIIPVWHHPMTTPEASPLIVKKVSTVDHKLEILTNQVEGTVLRCFQ